MLSFISSLCKRPGSCATMSQPRKNHPFGWTLRGSPYRSRNNYRGRGTQNGTNETQNAIFRKCLVPGRFSEHNPHLLGVNTTNFAAAAVFLDFRDMLAVSELEIVISNKFRHGIIIIAHRYEYAQQRVHFSTQYG